MYFLAINVKRDNELEHRWEEVATGQPLCVAW